MLSEKLWGWSAMSVFGSTSDFCDIALSVCWNGYCTYAPRWIYSEHLNIAITRWACRRLIITAPHGENISAVRVRTSMYSYFFHFILMVLVETRNNLGVQKLAGSGALDNEMSYLGWVCTISSGACREMKQFVHFWLSSLSIFHCTLYLSFNAH